VWRHPILVN